MAGALDDGRRKASCDHSLLSLLRQRVFGIGLSYEDISENGITARRRVVEPTHGWLGRFRRLPLRWEKKAENYRAMLHLAFAIICFRPAGVFG